ncbi:NagC/XylR-type transciptional regulator [Nostocoides japonicum T1-X7]|uniref:NagC/XylR-type transciptional regulator n=1 Tax=Nostocoides japonicum T1-X7 TaxID=1194083 RepID=A0A077LZI5_9MICO|nr:ROK family transcriptional regulator [Tetrasphaera japonica]CCH79378.1 NagC/XylR-type transciptional regulator [Tetrasphaera japonica T1-X7]
MPSPNPGLVKPRSAVLPTDGRRQNLSVVLQTLYTGGAQSRAELARRIGLTKVTVSDLVGALIETGHVVERGPSTAGGPGKPATLVDVDRTGLQVVGLDLAAADVLRAAVLDLDGNIVARAERALPEIDGERDGTGVLGAVLELTGEILGAATRRVLGVGVGTPGIVGPGGIVQTAPNLGWTDVELRATLADATGLPVFVCNDADAAVHADTTFGPGGDDVILVKIDRGVGCGVIVGGQRVRGAHHAAGEIGHVTVGTDGGTVCRCGKVGCLETWASAAHLEKALAAGEGPAALRDAGERLAIVLAPVVAALDLDEVVLSGPEHLLAGELLATVDHTLRDRLLAGPGSALTVRIAEHAEDIVLRGAAALILWDQLGVA